MQSGGRTVRMTVRTSVGMNTGRGECSVSYCMGVTSYFSLTLSPPEAIIRNLHFSFCTSVLSSTLIHNRLYLGLPFSLYLFCK